MGSVNTYVLALWERIGNAFHTGILDGSAPSRPDDLDIGTFDGFVTMLRRRLL